MIRTAAAVYDRREGGGTATVAHRATLQPSRSGKLERLFVSTTKYTNDTKTKCANGVTAIAGQVDYLQLAVSDPPTQADVQTIADKIDQLIMVLKRT